MMSKNPGIKAIDKTSIHLITSGQVVIDLQTAVKELVENSVDAGAKNVEVRFKHYGLKSVEVVDDGSGIAEADYESIALKHHTSKLEKYSDLASVRTFGFRGEALSSLCALSEQVTVSTATNNTTPMGVYLELDPAGKVKKQSKVARLTGTTITLSNLFASLPVRRKEFERNAKREFGKALSLLHAYALGPCAAGSGVRLTVSNQPDKGQKSVQIRTLGTPSPRDSVTALWGPKALENIVDMELNFEVERERSNLKRLQRQETHEGGPIVVQVKGLISKFTVGCGRTGPDRQFFYINGRPCNMSKIQKAFNEVYRSFNANQAPFILADFITPTDVYDVNVSPDKRTILLHSEGNLISALKAALEVHFSPSRSTFDLGGNQGKVKTQTLLPLTPSISTRTTAKSKEVVTEDDAEKNHELIGPPADASNPRHSSKPDVEPSLPANPLPTPRLGCLSPMQAPTSNTDEDANVDADRMADDSVVVDISQASWGKRLGLTPSPMKSSPRLSPEPQSPLGDEEQPVRKKRKSELGPVPGNHDIDNRGNTSGQSQEDDEAADFSIRRPMTTRVIIPQRPIGSNTSKRPSLKQTKIKFRDRLAGFSRNGSQVSSLQQGAAEEMEVDDEEEDQLDKSSDIEDAPSACPSKTRLVSSKPDSQLSKGSHVDDEDIEDYDVVDPAVEPDDEDDPSSVLSQARVTTSTTPRTVSQKDAIPHPEIIRSENGGEDVVLRFDVDSVRKRWERVPGRQETINIKAGSGQGMEAVPDEAGVSNVENDEKAANALARVINKDDFARMEIVGQFNLGFIIVRRRTSPATHDRPCDVAGVDKVMDDLFIVDQHAADEKFNFETLQATTNIQSQRLFRPRPLELTAADEILAIENIEVLRQNGFEIDVDEDGSFGQGSRLKLTAQPTSKNTVFDMKDLEEMIHLLRDRPTGQMVRCSKARAMFAMRACRKSVMVGMPLNRHQMTTVIRHMGTMDQPWNCPHGRPTMRHLLDIRSAGAHLMTGSRREVVWSSFC